MKIDVTTLANARGEVRATFDQEAQATLGLTGEHRHFAAVFPFAGGEGYLFFPAADYAADKNQYEAAIVDGVKVAVQRIGSSAFIPYRGERLRAWLVVRTSGDNQRLELPTSGTSLRPGTYEVENDGGLFLFTRTDPFNFDGPNPCAEIEIDPAKTDPKPKRAAPQQWEKNPDFLTDVERVVARVKSRGALKAGTAVNEFVAAHKVTDANYTKALRRHTLRRLRELADQYPSKWVYFQRDEKAHVVGMYLPNID